MAILYGKPGRTSPVLQSRVRGEVRASFSDEALGGVYPLHLNVYEMDKWVIRNGWPVKPPGQWINSETLISGVGEVVTARPAPEEIATEAAVRWVASSLFWDADALSWTSAYGSLPLTWFTSVGYAPTLLHDYEYRVGNERFYREALNFDSDEAEHLWADFSTLPATGYTVLMVVNLNSAYGNNADVPYNGIWGFGGVTPDVETFSETAEAFNEVTLTGNYLWMETEGRPRTRLLGVSDFLQDNAPMYLCLRLERPQATVTVGRGPSSMRGVTVPTGDEEIIALDPRVVLGRTRGDILHTADMALFDVGVYPGILSDEELFREVSVLSRSYGGDQ